MQLCQVKIRPLMDGNFEVVLFISAPFVKIRPLMDGNISLDTEYDLAPG